MNCMKLIFFYACIVIITVFIHTNDAQITSATTIETYNNNTTDYANTTTPALPKKAKVSMETVIEIGKYIWFQIMHNLN
jgi:hypothetical protein